MTEAGLTVLHNSPQRIWSRGREVIAQIERCYARLAGRGLPPGLAKRGGNLPPGLEKQLLRNGTVPPGLQKRLEPLPVELERRLPPLPPGCGCNRGVLGANVVLVRTRDQLILDALRLTGR